MLDEVADAVEQEERAGRVLGRVTRTRLGLLTRLYGDLGLAPAEASRRARIAYALYLGLEQLRRADGGRRGSRRTRG